MKLANRKVRMFMLFRLLDYTNYLNSRSCVQLNKIHALLQVGKYSSKTNNK